MGWNWLEWDGMSLNELELAEIGLNVLEWV